MQITIKKKVCTVSHGKECEEGIAQHYPSTSLHKTTHFLEWDMWPPLASNWLAFLDPLNQEGSLGCAVWPLLTSAAVDLFGNGRGRIRKPDTCVLSVEFVNDLIFAIISFCMLFPSFLAHEGSRRTGFTFPRTQRNLLSFLFLSSPSSPADVLFCSQWQRQMRGDSNYSEQEGPTLPNHLLFTS